MVNGTYSFAAKYSFNKPLFRQRLPTSHVFYYRSPIHQNHYVLSFAFAFEKEDEVYQFAIAPPYSFSRLQSYLSVIETRYPGLFERSELAKSLVCLLGHTFFYIHKVFVLPARKKTRFTYHRPCGTFQNVRRQNWSSSHCHSSPSASG